MVIGNAGGGKSTLCKVICAEHNMPYFSIDKIQWKPNWVLASDEEFSVEHQNILSGERWLVDGYGSESSIEDRLDACDTVVFVDHPIAVHYWWATKRQIKSLFRRHPDVPEGCRMWPVTIRLFRMMWRLHKEMRPKLIEAIYSRADSLRIIHIKSPAELKAFTDNPI